MHYFKDSYRSTNYQAELSSGKVATLSSQQRQEAKDDYKSFISKI